MRATFGILAVIAVSSVELWNGSQAFARPPGTTAPALKPASKPAFSDAWDTADDRLVFLTTQLASVETSIDAISKQLRISNTAQAGKKAEAEGHRKANEIMDRNLGMPSTIRWDKFYGRTAEKFFYHPVDRSTSYHTLTVLKQRKADNTDDQPDANGGVPIQQRPPQFDYIYRANNDRRATAEADAAKLAGKVNQLTARQRDLEAEQAKLWCQISARAVAYRDLLSSKLYRFDVKAADAADLTTQRLASFRAAVHFLRIANQLMVDADASNEVTASSYTQAVKATLGKARADLDQALVKQPLLALDVTEIDTWIGKLTAVARRMDDLSRNVGDSNRLALDGDAAGDEQRKQTFRQSLQDQLLILAEGVLAGDECVTAMRTEWKFEFDGTQPLAMVEMPTVRVPTLRIANQLPEAQRTTRVDATSAIGSAPIGQAVSQSSSVANGQAPKIIKLIPANGDDSVDPTRMEIFVTFDQPMADGFAFIRTQSAYPFDDNGDRAHWLNDRTFALPVKLMRNHDYELSINGEDSMSFASAAGLPLAPTIWHFHTDGK